MKTFVVNIVHFPDQMLGGYADFLYQIGLVDEKQRIYVQNQSDLGQQYIQQKKWKEAFEVSHRGPHDDLPQLKASDHSKGSEGNQMEVTNLIAAAAKK